MDPFSETNHKPSSPSQGPCKRALAVFFGLVKKHYGPSPHPYLEAIVIASVPVGMLLIGMVFSGCVSVSKCRREAEEARGVGYVEGLSRGRADCSLEVLSKSQRIRTLEMENDEKTKRLRNFNQVDENGRLRPLDKKAWPN